MSTDTLKQAPYQTLAEIYDHVMQHVDYDNWAAYIHSVFERFNWRPQKLVDLACGTGNITVELSNLDYVVSGVDLSSSMVREAQKKSPKIPFFVGDLRHLSEVAGLGPFDAAVCLYDSFNYLLTPDDFQKGLDEVFRILLPESLFIFDVCTESNSLRYFDDARDSGNGPGFHYKRHSYYDKITKLQYNHFLIQLDSRDKILEETHTQHIYPWEELLAHIKNSPFELLGAFDGFTFNKGSSRSDRIHFILQSLEPMIDQRSEVFL